MCRQDWLEERTARMTGARHSGRGCAEYVTPCSDGLLPQMGRAASAHTVMPRDP